MSDYYDSSAEAFPQFENQIIEQARADGIEAGCSASSEQVSVAAPRSAEKPEMIVVYPFAVDTEDVTLNQGFFERTYRD